MRLNFFLCRIYDVQYYDMRPFFYITIIERVLLLRILYAYITYMYVYYIILHLVNIFEEYQRIELFKS